MSGQKKRLVVGLLAHVDAGKTTLAEALLYTCGRIRSVGRVDHGNAYLDNYALERERGITIFSKQAELAWRDLELTLLDTPGHVDFSAEMERTLQVLDAAVLVVSGSDGVQSHLETLWRLLARYRIPVFLFVNKMDQEGNDRGRLLSELQEKLDGRCVDFTEVDFAEDACLLRGEETVLENIALCDEALTERYLEGEGIACQEAAERIASRGMFPCFFGSALRLTGVEKLLEGLRRLTCKPRYPDAFGARVFKISRDSGGVRLTHLKVTGGSLRVKTLLEGEKVDQIRIYSGASFDTAEELSAGRVCAVAGLTQTYAGEGLGCEGAGELPLLMPVLTYRLLLEEGEDPVTVLARLRLLEEEDPQLHILWQEEQREIHVQVMGQVQIEILERLLKERFRIRAKFGQGSIVYKETLAEPVEGIGHFEPLRHYAEVHLLLEPGEPGSGIHVDSACSTDELDRNWQRLILTHLEERAHPGVLTGSELTDVRITLLTGRAHQKHTEGGDFRQAVYRAVRQGLRRGKNILLEPVFSFALEVPKEQLGRAMSDIRRMNGSFEGPVIRGDTSVLTGTVPVACAGEYGAEVAAYTGGRGRFSCAVSGYAPCHNTQEVIRERNYDPDADTANPAGSVFCAHGAGFLVPWDEVERYAHGKSGWEPGLVPDGEGGFRGGEGTDGYGGSGASDGDALPGQGAVRNGGGEKSARRSGSDAISQEEIQEIFRQTYRTREEDPSRYRRYHRGEVVRERDFNDPKGAEAAPSGSPLRPQDLQPMLPKPSPEEWEDYLLVDGYNMIFAWEELRELAAVNIDSARDRLTDICANYQGYTGQTLILVFDAYRVKGNPGSIQRYHNIYVVYTKTAETADQYIEKAAHVLADGRKKEPKKKYRVTVATSDGLEQMIIFRAGATRLSAREFREAVEQAGGLFSERYGDRAVKRQRQIGSLPLDGVELRSESESS